MKKVLAVIGIVLPFIFWIMLLISIALLSEMAGEPTSSVIFVSYLKLWSLIGTIIGLITMIIGVVYLGREKGFTHKEIMSQSRTLTKKNVWKYILGLLLIVLVQGIQNGLTQPDQPTTIAIAIVFFLLMILYLWLEFGLRAMSLSLVQEKNIRATDVFVSPKKFFPYFVAYLMIWIATVLGTILFIIPGIIIWLRLNMVPFLILEKKIGPWTAIKESRKLTKGKISNLFALQILCGGINILGILAIWLGLFWTLPLFYIANAVFYKKLLAHTK